MNGNTILVVNHRPHRPHSPQVPRNHYNTKYEHLIQAKHWSIYMHIVHVEGGFKHRFHECKL